jgi:hypothetical protein
MTQKIPREVLWKDKTMEELLDDPLFNLLHEAFLYFDAQPMMFPLDELAVLNHVGYHVTWLCYESRFGMEPDMDQFEREVYANAGLSDHAKTIFSLVQAVVKLVNFPPLNISERAKRKLAQMNKNSWCRRFVDSFVRRVLRDGCLFREQFLPAQGDYVIPRDVEEESRSEVSMSAEPSREVQQVSVRRFTLEEIVTYAKENLSLDKSVYIQNMLYKLLSKDGTHEEREMVDSITAYILNRNAGDQVQGNKTSFGSYSNMVNFNLSEHTDYEQLFKALPPEIKETWRKQLMNTDNG